MKTQMTKIMPIMMRQRKIVNVTSDGRHKEWRYVNVPIEHECQGFVVNIDGKERRFYVPVACMTNRDKTSSWVCDESGNIINAVWQHGRYGTTNHVEPALFDWKYESFIGKLHYCNGNVKDCYKYLLRVLF